MPLKGVGAATGDGVVGAGIVGARVGGGIVGVRVGTETGGATGAGVVGGLGPKGEMVTSAQFQNCSGQPRSLDPS